MHTEAAAPTPDVPLTWLPLFPSHQQLPAHPLTQPPPPAASFSFFFPLLYFYPIRPNGNPALKKQKEIILIFFLFFFCYLSGGGQRSAKAGGKGFVGFFFMQHELLRGVSCVINAEWLRQLLWFKVVSHSLRACRAELLTAPSWSHQASRSGTAATGSVGHRGSRGLRSASNQGHGVSMDAPCIPLEQPCTSS